MKKNVLLIIASCSLLLSACGSNNNYDAKDKSVDYLSARALPPLVKSTSTNTSNNSSKSMNTQSSKPPARSSVVIASKPAENAIWKVVSASSRYSRIQTGLDMSQAWSAFADKLTAAAVTIVSRSSENTEYKVSCLPQLTAESDGSQNVSGSQKRGWSIFKSSEAKEDFCRFSFDLDDGQVTIKYLDQTGKEVPGEISTALLTKIVN